MVAKHSWISTGFRPKNGVAGAAATPEATTMNPKASVNTIEHVMVAWTILAEDRRGPAKCDGRVEDAILKDHACKA